MSNIVTGQDLPKDLMAVLTKYGLPEHTISFKLECESTRHELIMTATFYSRMPDEALNENFKSVEETGTFKILRVE